MIKIINKLLPSIGIVVFPNVAFAYIGPGLGVGTVVVVLGILLSLILGIFAVFWYPIKRLFKRKKGPATDSNEVDSSEQ